MANRDQISNVTINTLLLNILKTQTIKYKSIFKHFFLPLLIKPFNAFNDPRQKKDLQRLIPMLFGIVREFKAREQRFFFVANVYL